MQYSITSIGCGFHVHLVPAVVQQLARFDWRIMSSGQPAVAEPFVTVWKYCHIVEGSCQQHSKLSWPHETVIGSLQGTDWVLEPLFSGVCVCLCHCWSQPWALQKWMNRSRCNFVCGLVRSRGTVNYWCARVRWVVHIGTSWWIWLQWHTGCSEAECSAVSAAADTQCSWLSPDDRVVFAAYTPAQRPTHGEWLAPTGE